MSFPHSIDDAWTLFLDRDGVVNVRLPGDYVKRYSDFTFHAGAKEAIALLSKIFGRIIIVTNQRGIARGLMTEEDLSAVHLQMIEEISAAGGRIDAILYCPHDRDTGCICRKPKTGMALKAKELFPEIDFSRAIIAGDSKSDMEFGANCGMIPAAVHGHNAEEFSGAEVFDSLADFASRIQDGLS